MPEITVVITTHNLERFIASCLDDLLNQSFQYFNVLIVDDCSDDKTVDIVEQYIKRAPSRIRTIFLKENLGSPARSRNKALDSGLIDGEYVVFLDGDDRLEPNFLQCIYSKACDYKCDVAICAYDRVELETGHVLCTEMRGFEHILDLNTRPDRLVFINGSLWNKLIKTSLIGDIRIPDFKVGEDLCFQHAIYHNCKKLAFTDDVLIHYQMRESSIISNTCLNDIHEFANQLLSNYNSEIKGTLKDTLALVAFVHIGISMAIRAYDNKSINLKEHLQWTHKYFTDNFSFFNNNTFFSINSLKKHGIKGYAIWFCRILHKYHCFGLFLFFYKLIVKIFKIDFKF